MIIFFSYFSQFLVVMKEEQESSSQKFEINRVSTFQPCFQTNASLLSRMFFAWTHKLIMAGKRKALEMEDLSDLSPKEEPTYSYERFSKIFYGFNPEQSNKILKSFWLYLGPMFVLSGLLAALANALQFSGPIVIGKVLQYLANNEPIEVGLGWVTVLVVCYLLRTIIFQHSMHFVNLSCVRVLNCGNSLIYHKILNLSGASRKYLETGSIMNYINLDVMSFYYFVMMSTFLFSAPVMITIAVALLIVQVGWIGLVAPVLFIIGIVIQQRLMKSGFEIRKDQLFWSDKRTKCVNEYFSGIRIIKYYGWEELVADKIENIRTEELSLNMRLLMIRTWVDVLMNMIPISASIIIFAVYAAIEGEEALTPAKVYSVLSLFNLIATPLRLIVITVINYMNAHASLERIQHFFGYEDKNNQGFQTDDQELQKGQITFNDCLFDWEKEEIKQHFEEGKKLRRKPPTSLKKKQEAKEVSKASDEKPKKKKKKKKKESAVEELPADGTKKKNKKKNKAKKQSILTDGDMHQNLLPEKIEQSPTEPEVHENALTIPNLKIGAGQFLGVVGRVGSGKSTLLYSILGEIDKQTGTVRRRGSIAYIPQISWLRSATIRENIIFEAPVFDEDRYHEILKICELEPDLEIFGGGDLTEIGEKGVNMSGGQKQRISIARALYADADIYLIDDCLSALDSYVGKSIFHNVLREYLHKRGKTVVFVTNAIDFTDYCDRILVMDKGMIADEGTPEELKSSGGVFGDLKMQFKKSKQAEEDEKLREVEAKERKRSESEEEITIEEEGETKEKKKKQLQGLVKVQERLKGSVPWAFYVRFFTGPGAFSAIVMFMFIVIAQMARVLSDWWLGEWSKNGFEIPEGYYIWIYAAISVLVISLIYVKGFFFSRFIVKSSRVIQRKLIAALLKTPLSWFDVTPTGRILARATKDQDDLDNSLAFNAQFATQNILVLIASVTLISVATPMYLIVAFFSGIIYYFLIGLYMGASREIKRLEANTRAPLISHIQETISGIAIIRAFDKTDRFIEKYFRRQKDNIVAIANQNITSRWINLVTDLFSIVTVSAAGYFGVLSVVIDVGGQSTNMIGLSMLWSLQISAIMSFTLRVMADTESNMNAVVRLYDYIDNNPSEFDFKEPKPASENWPSRGEYSIKDISYKYRPELPYVLKKISFDIESKANIGVVGRTGSGKSTMTLGLLRILELIDNEDGTMGKIELDGENTSELGLHHLRHNITIIPQDPTLFTGTIRTNIDPFNQYSDAEIANCLKKVELWDQIKGDKTKKNECERKVYGPVDESGSNFSLGQRQLMCMARALIRKPSVLLMDEATASIDEKTDETIQKMIRKEFTETTVITIAHRLNTIIYYDKILVLENGSVQEYDKPIDLVKNPDSFLGKLIRKTGSAYMEKIIALAEKAQMKPI